MRIVGQIFIVSLVFATAACGKLSVKQNDDDAPTASVTESALPDVVAAGPKATVVAGAATKLVGESGRLQDASFTFPDGALPPGAQVEMNEVARPASFVGLPGLTPVSAAVQVTAHGEGGVMVTTAKAATATLPLDEGTNDFDHLCVVLDATDGLVYQWRRHLLRLAVDGRSVTFQTSRLGVFQVSLCAGDLGDLAKDAKAEGAAGDFAPLAAMRIIPSDFPAAGSATFACLLLTRQGAFVDGAVLPLGVETKTVYLVADVSSVVDADEYDLTLRMTSAPCALSDDGVAGGVGAPAFGPFTQSGASLKSGAADGVLGDASGPFPLAHVTLDLTSGDGVKVAEAEALSACLTATAADGKTLGAMPLNVRGAALDGEDGPYLFWFVPSAQGAYDVALRLGVSCAELAEGGDATSVLNFDDVAAGAALAAAAVPLEVRAPSDSTPASACLDALADDGSTTVLGSFDVTGTPPPAGAGLDYPVATIFAYFPTATATPGRYVLKVYTYQTCSMTRQGSPDQKPATIDAVTQLDVEL